MLKMAAHEKDVTTTDLSVTTTQDTVRVCELCLNQPSKYKCPQCGLFYCSLLCYRGVKHSGCSEKFYKDQFLEVLKDKTGNKEDRKKMLEILQRVDVEYKPLFDDEGEEVEDEDEEEEEEGETVETLGDRIAGLDLDKDIDLVWERLTVKERREFETVLHAGKLGALVPVWKPWWEQHDQDLIREINIEPAVPSQSPPSPDKPSYVDEIEQDLENMAADFGLTSKDDQTSDDDVHVSSELLTPCQCPSVLEKTPRLNEILQHKKPSGCVAYNLLNVLYSYSFAVRLYNGAHSDLPVQVARNVLEVSSTLSDNANFMETVDSLASAIHNSSKRLLTSNVLSTSILRDITHILLGGSSGSPISYIQSALSDLHRLFGAAKEHLANECKPSASSTGSIESNSSRLSKKQLQRTCFNCQKKLEFFLAWIVENTDKPRILLIEVESMYRSRQLLDEQHSATKSALEKQWGGPRPPVNTQNRLIEEVS